MATSNIMRGICLLIITFILSITSKAQELPIYSQYILNPYLINPAIAGVEHCGIAQAMSRIQWLGVKDAPVTHVFSYHQGINHIGLGGYVYSDKNGYSSNTGFELTYAYHIPLGNKHKYGEAEDQQLSFGISLTGNQKSVDQSSFQDINNDPLVSGVTENSSKLNGNAGIYYVNNNFFTGFSCANLIPVSNGLYSPQRSYFYQIGRTFYLKKDFVWEPSITTKFNKDWDWQLDANIKLVFNSRFWAALSLRNNMGYTIKEGLSVMPVVGYKLSSRLRIGYAFDYGLNAIRSHNYGTHEFMLMYKFCTDKDNGHCPAYKDYSKRKYN